MQAQSVTVLPASIAPCPHSLLELRQMYRAPAADQACDKPTILIFQVHGVAPFGAGAGLYSCWHPSFRTACGRGGPDSQPGGWWLGEASPIGGPSPQLCRLPKGAFFFSPNPYVTGQSRIEAQGSWPQTHSPQGVWSL